MSRKWRILLVDDEERVARTLKLGLVASGQFEVHIETRGTQALATARQFDPHLILLDVILPDRRGEDILHDLRADEQLRDVPVLFLTATAQTRRGDIQPNEWINKPILAADVIRQMNRWLPRATGADGDLSRV